MGDQCVSAIVSNRHMGCFARSIFAILLRHYKASDAKSPRQSKRR